MTGENLYRGGKWHGPINAVVPLKYSPEEEAAQRRLGYKIVAGYLAFMILMSWGLLSCATH